MDSKRYYWIKLKTDFFSRDTIDFLLSQNNGCEYVVLYQMLCLNTANNNGQLATNIGEMIVPYDVEKIARDTKYFTEDTIRVALELYKQLGLIYVGDNNLLQIAEFNELVGSETSWAEKKRIYREKQKGQLKDIVREENRDKRLEYRDKSIDIDDVLVMYEENFGTLSSTTTETIISLEDEYTPKYVKEAMKRAIINNKKSLAYVKGILKQWKNKTWDEIVNETGKDSYKDYKRPKWLDMDLNHKEEASDDELTELEDLFKEYKEDKNE